MAASDKVILRLSDLVSWITDQVDWMTGLQTQTIITPAINNHNSNSNNNGKYQLLHQSLHPIAINSGLDFNDVIHEKQVNGKKSALNIRSQNQIKQLFFVNKFLKIYFLSKTLGVFCDAFRIYLYKLIRDIKALKISHFFSF